MDDAGKCYIGIDESVMDGDALERVHMGHELRHCVTGSFYNRYTPYDLRQRHENRADKWAILHWWQKAAAKSGIWRSVSASRSNS